MFKMDLQLFADKANNEPAAENKDDIVIPEEFDGIDRDIALGIMRENGLLDKPEDNQPGADQGGQQPGPDDKSSTTNPDESSESEPDGKPAPVKEPETGEEDNGSEDDGDDDFDGEEGDDKHQVPRAALKSERKKRQAAQKEAQKAKEDLEKLKTEINQLKAQNRINEQAQQPPTQPVAQPQQLTEEQQLQQQKQFEEYIDKAAREKFAKLNGREPDDLEVSDAMRLARYSVDIEQNIRNQIRQQKERQQSQAHRAQSYKQFVVGEMAKPDFNDVQTAVIEDLKAMPENERQVFGESFSRCEKGQCSPQDIMLVKRFWDSAANKCRQSKSPATDVKPEPEKKPAEEVPPKPAKKTAEDKLTEIEKHTKANLVTGSSVPTGLDPVKLARKMREKGWDELTVEEQEYLLTLNSD